LCHSSQNPANTPSVCLCLWFYLHLCPGHFKSLLQRLRNTFRCGVKKLMKQTCPALWNVINAMKKTNSMLKLTKAAWHSHAECFWDFNSNHTGLAGPGKELWV
jgi:hypothetical protein